MGLLSRIFRPSAVKAVEGEYRPGPYLTNAGWIGAGWATNFWQQGYDPAPAIQSSAILEACVSAYAQTIAMCPGDHWRTRPDGGRERITTSALSRILRQPNTYQGSSDFLLGLVRSLYAEGNAYALARRNVRFEVTELHLMSPSASAASVAENGEIFYSLGGNAVAERIFGFPIRGVPARDVLHVRLNTGYDPLRGQSPFASALLDGALGTAMQRQALHFYGNRSVPSGVLSTDQVLNREQMDQMAERWREKSQGLGAGDVPILAAGIKFQSVAASAKDMEFAAVMKMTQENIALAYRVPLQILGIGATPFASTEALMASWKASGLGFAVNHVEQAFDRLFRLPGAPIEYTQFDTSELLRSSMKERIDALVHGIQGGLYSPNEGRLIEGLPSAAFGDEPRVQQQVVPLSAAGAIPSAPPAPPALPQPAPPQPAPTNREDETYGGVGGGHISARDILDAADRHERRSTH
jgi:HK97 family phage portal protein